MKKTTQPNPHSRTGRRARNRSEQAAWLAALREPAPDVDEALCERIMATVRQAKASESPARPMPESRGIPYWAGAAAALGAAAVLVLLVSRGLSPDGSNSADRGPGIAARESGTDHPATISASSLVQVRLEQERLVSDTRQIASFLSKNLRL